MKAKRLWVVALCALAGCWESPPREIVLQYTPTVGGTYQYRYDVNLDKTTFGKTANEHSEMALQVEVLAKQGSEYQTRWTASVIRENAAVNVGEPRTVTISDRYVSDDAGIGNLSLPTGPLKRGATWTGEHRLQLGDLMAGEPPRVPVEHKLTRIRKKSGRVDATIESHPTVLEVDVPMEVGSLGIDCDADGRVEAVREGSPADGRVLPGDVLLGMNGEKAATPDERHRLAQALVEAPSAVTGRPVLLALRRAGLPTAVSVKPELVNLGTLHVTIQEAERTVVYDVDNGIPITDDSTAHLVVAYRTDANTVKTIDDYVGRKEPLRVPGAGEPPREYDYRWSLELIR